MGRPRTPIAASQRFGVLTFLAEETLDAHGNRRGVFRCDCGARVETTLKAVRAGKTRSCGCLRRQRAAEHSRLPEYRVWSAMKTRCGNPNSTSYDLYGGRGIDVCERWGAFPAFLADMGLRPSARHTIERIDGTKGYEPGNCRWATRTEQNRNRRNNVVVRYGGAEMCLAEACRLAARPLNTVFNRMRRGMPFEDAIRLPGRR